MAIDPNRTDGDPNRTGGDSSGTRASRVPRHPIGVVTRRTGLSASLLRAWERRYGAVEPGRSTGGQRLYSDADIRRLLLLKSARAAGRTIGQVAYLSDEELETMVAEDSESTLLPGREDPGGTTDDDVLLRHALAAVESTDAQRLDRHLMQAAVVMRPLDLVERLVQPLLVRVGRGWEAGRVRPADEHLASGVVRRFLDWMIGTIEVPVDAPVIVCATPGGQRHELGALMSAVTAAGAGWRAIYVGSDLPPAEVAYAAGRLGASAVALSVIHPPLDVVALRELSTLSELLAPTVPLLVGGPALEGRVITVEALGGEVLDNMTDLHERLTAERQRRQVS